MLTYNESLDGIKRVLDYGFKISFEDLRDDTTLKEMQFDTLLMREFELHIQNHFGIEEDINECLYPDSTLEDIARSVMKLLNSYESEDDIIFYDDEDDGGSIALVILGLITFAIFGFLMLS